jgi:RNA polymerase sigma factor (sigma-70 family)
MGGFRRLDESALARLDDDQLVGYAVAARRAEDHEAEECALQIFAFGMESRILAFVRTELGSHGDDAIEEVAARALQDAIVSIRKLDGTSAGEARSFVMTIAARRIVDYHRRGRLDTEPLETEFGDEESLRREIADSSAEGETEAVVLRVLIEEALGELGESHRLVVELSLLRGHSAKETAARVNSRNDGRSDDSMSEQNVHKIVSRFRKSLQQRIEGTVRTG